MKNLSKTFIWILMGLLIVGLAGFGAVNGTSAGRTVATVGSAEVSVDDYARALQQEQRALQAQSGQAFPMAQLTALGLDRAVLNRLVTTAALDNEVETAGISIGDETLFEQITQVSAFQDGAGNFDRNAYAFALENAGLSETEFERDMRAEAARILAQGAIMSGAEMSPVLGQTLTDYIGARRSFSYLPITASDIALTTVLPKDAELQAFYDANVDAFTLPETKDITYVALRPEALLDTIEVDADALRALYDERAAEFIVPERRLVERLVFANDDAAATAKAQLDVGGTTFEVLVSDRGLALADIDLGDLSEAELGAAGKGVFAAEVGAVVGPLPSDLGPALYRVNGTLDARETTFEQAEPSLRDELAGDRARRVIEARSEEIDDLLAGGATLEELASEQELELGQIGWTANSTDGIAAFNGFREAAATVTEADFPAVAFLEDGSLFALRLNETLPPRPEPFEEARDNVMTAFQADRLAQALTAQAETLRDAAVSNGGSFAEGAPVIVETGLRRTSYIDTAPVEMMAEVFNMEPGEVRVVSDDESTVVVRLDEILPPEQSEEMDFMASALQDQLSQSLANELFQVYVDALRSKDQPQINQQTINAVHASFQ